MSQCLEPSFAELCRLLSHLRALTELHLARPGITSGRASLLVRCSISLPSTQIYCTGGSCRMRVPTRFSSPHPSLRDPTLKGKNAEEILQEAQCRGSSPRGSGLGQASQRVQPGKSGLSLLQVLAFGRSEESGCRQTAAAERTSLFQQMPGGWGARGRGLEQGLYPAPCTPARGTALKSCGVCHRPASPRMRIRKVEFFSPPLSLSLFSSLWFCNLKKKFFFFLLREHQGKGVRRGRECGSWPGGPGAGGGTRSRRSVSRSAGLRIAGKAAARPTTPPPPARVRFRAAAAERAPPAAAAGPSTARRPPALPPLGPGRQTRRWAAPPAVDLRS